MLRLLQHLMVGFLLNFMVITAALAHNKVVVIPMTGNGVKIIPEPYNSIAGNSPSIDDYIISTDTVVDNITRLEWQRQDDNTTRNWEDAFAYCIDLVLGGKTDWRLPLREELISIVDYSTHQPAINTTAFPSTEVIYWSASLARLNTLDSVVMWDVKFNSGVVNGNPVELKEYVRCVR